MELDLQNRILREISDDADGPLRPSVSAPSSSFILEGSKFISITDLLNHLHGHAHPQGHPAPRSRMGRLQATRVHKSPAVISSRQAREAIDHHIANADHIINVLIHRGVASEDDLVVEFTAQHGFPYIPLSNYDVSHEALRLVSRSVALRHLVVPMDVMGNNLMVAMANPLDTHAIREVETQSGCFIQVFVSKLSDIKRALLSCYPDSLSGPSLDLKDSTLS